MSKIDVTEVVTSEEMMEVAGEQVTIEDDGTEDPMIEIPSEDLHVQDDALLHESEESQGHGHAIMKMNEVEEIKIELTPNVLPQIPFSFPGQTFDTKCQKLILNVWDFFKRVKKNPDIFDEIRTPQERAAAALHISAATIGKIGKNFKKTGKLEAPGTMRKRHRPVVDSVNSTDEDMIREIIEDMRLQKLTPTLPSVLAEARHRINFTGGATSFRRVLARMGYKNLSQKGVLTKARVVETTMTGSSLVTFATPSQPPQIVQLKSQHHQPGFTTLKVIKTDNNKGPTLVPVLTSSPKPGSSTEFSSTPNTIGTSKLLQTGNIIQLTNGQQVQLMGNTGADNSASSSTTSNNPNAAQLAIGAGTSPQTLYIQQPDNTIRAIQIVFATTSNNSNTLT